MFSKCKTKEECKTLFKRLAKRLHPDLGGEHDLMILLIEAHERQLKWTSFYDDELDPLSNPSSSHKPKNEPNKKQEKETPSSFAPWDGIFSNVVEDVFLGDPRLTILDEILKYATKNPTFKTDFTESVKGFLNKKNYITSSQYNTLVKIYFSFRMDEKEEEENPKDNK